MLLDINTVKENYLTEHLSFCVLDFSLPTNSGDQHQMLKMVWREHTASLSLVCSGFFSAILYYNIKLLDIGFMHVELFTFSC